MSKRGKSMRRRKFEAILDALLEPPFHLCKVGEVYLVEPTPNPLFEPSAPVSDDVIYHHRDREAARFRWAYLTAEALLEKIEKDARI